MAMDLRSLSRVHVIGACGTLMGAATEKKRSVLFGMTPAAAIAAPPGV